MLLMKFSVKSITYSQARNRWIYLIQLKRSHKKYRLQLVSLCMCLILNFKRKYFNLLKKYINKNRCLLPKYPILWNYQKYLYNQIRISLSFKDVNNFMRAKEESLLTQIINLILLHFVILASIYNNQYDL